MLSDLHFGMIHPESRLSISSDLLHSAALLGYRPSSRSGISIRPSSPSSPARSSLCIVTSVSHGRFEPVGYTAFVMIALLLASRFVKALVTANTRLPVQTKSSE